MKQSTRKISARLYQMFEDSSISRRFIQSLRPYICPFESVIDHIPVDARVFDIGCGGGVLLGLLADQNRISFAIGVDADPGAIVAANAMAKHVGVEKLEFKVAPSWSDWPQDEFDVVTLIDVMHHIPVAYRVAFFNEASRRVRPGGLLIYKDMCRRPKWRALANQMHDLVMTREWITHESIEMVEQWGRRGSWTIEHREDIPLLWYGHELLILKRKCTGHDQQ